MKHLYFISIFGLALAGSNTLSSMNQEISAAKALMPEAPSSTRIFIAGMVSPFASLGACALTGYVTDLVAQKKYGYLSPVRFLVAATTAFATYQLFHPTMHWFNTLLSGDINKLIKLVGKDAYDTGIMHRNEEAIKEILREILCVKNKILDLTKCQSVSKLLQTDLFVKDIPKIIGDMNEPKSKNDAKSVHDILKNTQALVSIEDMAYAYWWSTSIGKTVVWAKNTIAAPFTYARNCYDRMCWNFNYDARLLATLGGKKIEQAVKNIFASINHLFEYNGCFAMNAQLVEEIKCFAQNASMIARYAEEVLKDLKAQRESMQRVRDIVFLFKKPSLDIRKNENNESSEYSIQTTLSNLY